MPNVTLMEDSFVNVKTALLEMVSHAQVGAGDCNIYHTKYTDVTVKFYEFNLLLSLSF